MLTPAIRAKALPLPLLVPRVLADHEDAPVAADDLALLAHRLDRRSYLHDPFRRFDPDRVALVAGPATATSPRKTAGRNPSSLAASERDGSEYQTVSGAQAPSQASTAERENRHSSPIRRPGSSPASASSRAASSS